MILIKLWWSLIAPKDNPWYINTEYLKKFYGIIKNHKTIIVHGTGNIWHGFIRNYWLSNNTYSIWRNILDKYFQYIDNQILWCKRLKYQEIIKRDFIEQNTIIGWDITKDLQIISSDKIFAKILAKNNTKIAIIATDVDGVLDTDNQIIWSISKDNLENIHFRSKPWDVTGSMKEKIQQLITHNNGSKKVVRICNGYNLENIENIITTGKWIGTQILL